MLSTSIRRSSHFRWFSIAGAVAVTSALVTSPAHAAPPAGLDVGTGSSSVALGSAGKSVPVWYSANRGTDPNDQAPLPASIKLTIDTSASKAFKVQTAQPSPGCTTSGTKITCQAQSSSGNLTLRLIPVAGAKVGDTGHIVFTVTAPGATTDTESYDPALVASGPDLQMSSSTATVAAGGSTSSRPWVTNSGDQTAPTIVLTLNGGSYTRFPVHYNNCHYQTDSYGFETGVCLLKDIKLAPGRAITPLIASPFPIQVKTNVPGQLRINRYDPAGQPYGTYLSYSVEAFDSTPVDDRLNWPLGTGPALGWHLISTPQATKLKAAALTEADPYDNWGQQYITVSPNNPTDVAALGASVSGKVGATVTANVGIQNNGPAAIATTPGAKGGDPADPYNAGFTFTPPKNATVTNIVLPSDPIYSEWIEKTSSTGVKSYLVLPYSLPDGQKFTAQIQLKITATGAAKGTVVGQGGTHDPSTANNTATVTVTGS